MLTRKSTLALAAIASVAAMALVAPSASASAQRGGANFGGPVSKGSPRAFNHVDPARRGPVDPRLWLNPQPLPPSPPPPPHESGFDKQPST
jgi:hypothetical protein